MIIEKSPHHIVNSNRVKKFETIDQKNLKKNENTKPELVESSFWNWFKGLVNPLQNLPLISGIYSSVNSENEDSDRDLVQNSLGGFLYGGPIGAIVGFGNWAFNKIFDKTPTEMALDASGISDIWKDDPTTDDKVKQLASNDKNNVDNNLKLHIQYSSNNRGEIKGDLGSDKLTNLNKKELVVSLEEPIFESKIISNEIKNHILNKNEVDIKKKLNLALEENINEDKKLKSNNIPLNKENDVKFREINFSYPVWKPEEKIRSGKKIEFLKKEYENLGEDIKKEVRVDA